MLAWRQRHIEQVDAWRRLVDDRLQRALERPQTDDFELAQIRDRLGALGVLDPSLPERGAKVRLNRNVLGLSSIDSIFCPRFRREGSANPPDRKLSPPRSRLIRAGAQSAPLIMSEHCR